MVVKTNLPVWQMWFYCKECGYLFLFPSTSLSYCFWRFGRSGATGRMPVGSVAGRWYSRVVHSSYLQQFSMYVRDFFTKIRIVLFMLQFPICIGQQRGGGPMIHEIKNKQLTSSCHLHQNYMKNSTQISFFCQEFISFIGCT